MARVGVAVRKRRASARSSGLATTRSRRPQSSQSSLAACLSSWIVMDTGRAARTRVGLWLSGRERAVASDRQPEETEGSRSLPHPRTMTELYFDSNVYAQ